MAGCIYCCYLACLLECLVSSTTRPFSFSSFSSFFGVWHPSPQAGAYFTVFRVNLSPGYLLQSSVFLSVQSLASSFRVAFSIRVFSHSVRSYDVALPQRHPSHDFLHLILLCLRSSSVAPPLDCLPQCISISFDRPLKPVELNVCR